MASGRWQIAHWTYLAVLFCLMPICTLAYVFACWHIPTYYTMQALGDHRTLAASTVSTNRLDFRLRNSSALHHHRLISPSSSLDHHLGSQMPPSRKLRLMAIFRVGFVSSLASIRRGVLTARLGGDATCKFFTYLRTTLNVLMTEWNS